MDTSKTTKHNHKHINNETQHYENSAQGFTPCLFFLYQDLVATTEVPDLPFAGDTGQKTWKIRKKKN